MHLGAPGLGNQNSTCGILLFPRGWSCESWCVWVKVGKSSFKSLLFLAKVFFTTFFVRTEEVGRCWGITIGWTNDCLQLPSFGPMTVTFWWYFGIWGHSRWCHVWNLLTWEGLGQKLAKKTTAISWTIDCDLWMIFFEAFQITINGVTFGSSLTDTRKQGRISETPAKVYLLFQRRQFRDFCLNCLYWVFRWIFIPWNLEARIAPIGNFHQLDRWLWPFDDNLGISGLCYTFVMFQIILQVFLWLLNIQESEENLKSHLTLTNRSVFCSLQTALLPFIPAQAIQLCLDLNCLHWALKWLCSPRNPLVI